jgi:2'-5' RNA ligase
VGDGQARIRWVRVESLHITLRFLGPTPLEAVPDLVRAAGDAAGGSAPFSVTIAGSGAFPDPSRPRTLWLGIERGASELADLAHRLDDALRQHQESSGVDGGRGGKPFSPHLTLARTDGLRLGGVAAAALARAAEGVELTFEASRIVLFRSHLGEGPSWYEPVGEAVLGEGPPS